MHYGNVQDPTGYQGYSNQPQYRGDESYSSSNLGPQQYPSENQMPQQQQQQQQYGDMSQGYPSSYDPQGRNAGYPPTTRGW